MIAWFEGCCTTFANAVHFSRDQSAGSSLVSLLETQNLKFGILDQRLKTTRFLKFLRVKFWDARIKTDGLSTFAHYFKYTLNVCLPMFAQQVLEHQFPVLLHLLEELSLLVLEQLKGLAVLSLVNNPLVQVQFYGVQE